MRVVHRILRHPSWYLWPIPGLFAFVAQRLLAVRPALVENAHTRHLFRYLSVPIGRLSSMAPFSITEWLVLIGVPLLAAGFVVWLVSLIRKRERRAARIGRLLKSLAWITSSLYLVFMLLHGLNYARKPAAEIFDLPVRDRSAIELAEATNFLTVAASQLRADCPEDDQGIFVLDRGINETLRTLSAAYDAAAVQYPVLAGPAIRPKGVMLSHAWSYTGISGMYFPFLVEANVNIDMPHYQIPFTALHEIAHTRGFAREDEANFLAFLTGIADQRADIAYSVVVDAAGRALSALHDVDREAWKQAAANLDEAVWRDFAAANAYWQQFEGPIRETSVQINHAYLQANLQHDGVKSYGRMLDLVLAWYEDRSEAGQLDNSIAALAEKGD
ncbi:MAG: DUF3810 domain-containing protein [Saccharofermentanales bacterium]|jgi:hypothetical protein